MAGIDPARLSEWFAAYGPALVLYARSWLDAARAEDVVQDAFCRLVSQRREPAAVKGWLFRTVRNAALTHLRSRRRRQRHERRGAVHRPGWFDARPDDLVDAEQVQQAVAALPEPQREVVVLRLWCNMTLQDIADLTGQPVSTLFSRYRAALGAMRERMQRPCSKNA